MFKLSHTVQPHPQVVDTPLEGEGIILFHVESQIYFCLNLTGTWIWQAMKQGMTLQDISRGLQEKFEVDEDKANSSVLSLISELAEKQLVQRDHV